MPPEKPSKTPRKKPLSQIRRQPVTRAEESTAPPPPATTKVGLKPAAGWNKRNFFTQVFLPTIFSRRTGAARPAIFDSLAEDDVCITWIGHASFLIRINGKNILIDPNWSKWLSVIKRIKHPGIELHDLPDIDLVLVTHAHFDHLDRRTLRSVAEEQPIIVPHGVGNLVHDLGFNEVHELAEWQSLRIFNTEITLTPCHHWGARVLYDSHRGFGGFHIRSGSRTVFHCGDSAYFPGFCEIGNKLETDIALLPIGAYDAPSGREVHMNPEQAVQTFLDIKARTFIPMHYGTFRLTYEPVHEPLERLARKAAEANIADKLAVLEEGVPAVFRNPSA